MDNFNQRKKDVLSKLDKSSIGKWDFKITKLCNKINLKENYYTTSSCSGRILLMIDQEKKGENLFLFVSHDKISFRELKNEIDKIVSPPVQPREKIFTHANALLKIKFKLEPAIIHIACKNLEDAEKLFEIGKNAGWKRLGIIGMRNGFTFELNSTEKLEFPIIKNKKILVDDNFLKIVVDEANGKLERGWEKIQKLQKLI